MSLNYISTKTSFLKSFDLNSLILKDLMFFLLKEFSENLEKLNILTTSRAVLKLASFLGYSQYLLSSQSSQSLNSVQSLKKYCINCNQNIPICTDCLSSVFYLGILCRKCRKLRDFSQNAEGFTKDHACEADCSCLEKFPSSSDALMFSRYTTR